MDGVYLMARAGRFDLKVDFSKFERNLKTTVSRVERGTKKATIEACEDIKVLSLNQVPRDTNTLASSFFYEVHGKYRNFTATLGYGGLKDRTNPKSLKLASSYMVAVHEDLTAHHPIGKAKFLEDPIREYQQQKLLGTFARNVKKETGI